MPELSQAVLALQNSLTAYEKNFYAELQAARMNKWIESHKV
jgi:hypothetical protein